MEDDYDFDCVEIPSYEEFKETLTSALKNNPLNWSQKRKYTETRATKTRAESVESNTGSTISSQGSGSGSSADNSPTGTASLNLQTSQIFQRRQMKKIVQEETDMCKKKFCVSKNIIYFIIFFFRILRSL